MVKVLRLNLVFIVLYYLHFKIEIKAEFMVPSMDNMVEFNSRAHLDQNPLKRYNHMAVDVERANPEDVAYPKLKRKKSKKKNHNKKKNIIPGNEITDEDTKKKFKKNNLNKRKRKSGNEITDEDRKKKTKKKKSRRFIKSMLKNGDNSIESGEKRKLSPVDIIVHIKMSE